MEFFKGLFVAIILNVPLVVAFLVGRYVEQLKYKPMVKHGNTLLERCNLVKGEK